MVNNIEGQFTTKELMDHIQETWTTHYDVLPPHIQETVHDRFVPRAKQQPPTETILELDDLPI
jgi:hypothetical protein